jgi:hypothetical protein
MKSEERDIDLLKHDLSIEIKIEDIKKELATEIFDRLYFGDDNIIIIGETPCLQTLNHGGVKMLKHEALIHFLENFNERFHNLAWEYTDGERGHKGKVTKND